MTRSVTPHCQLSRNYSVVFLVSISLFTGQLIPALHGILFEAINGLQQTT